MVLERKVIKSEREARAYLHPVRLRIVQRLVSEQLTVSQIASEFEVHPANLTHHFRILVDAGLIRLTEERDIGRVVEKYYRAVAQTYEVRAEGKPLAGAGRRALGVLKDALSSGITQMEEQETHVLALLMNARISTRNFAKFSRKLEKLIGEFQNKSDQNGRKYTLCAALYPLPRAPGEKKTES